MEYKYRDTTVFYNVLGDGNELIVLLHGWGGDSDLMLPLTKNFSQINHNFTYLIIDFPPFGKSEESTEVWNLGDYSSLTREIITEILICKKFESINFIGHSFGGRVAIKICSEVGNGKNYKLEKIIKINKLILLASAGIKPKFSFKNKVKILKYRFYKKIGSDKALKFGSNDYKNLSSVMKRTFNNIIKEDLTQNCKKIMTKTLIIWGEKDRETPLYMGKKINRLIKESELLVLKNGNHFVYLHLLNLLIPIINTFILTN